MHTIWRVQHGRVAMHGYLHAAIDLRVRREYCLFLRLLRGLDIRVPPAVLRPLVELLQCVDVFESEHRRLGAAILVPEKKHRGNGRPESNR